MSEPVRIESAEQFVNLLASRAALATTATPTLAGKPYCPGSGTEGMEFEAEWCGDCSHYRETVDGAWDCRKDIIGRAHMVADANDPEFPKEWVYDEEGRPSCSAFEEADDEEDDRKMHRLCGGVTTPWEERALYEAAMRGEL